MSKTAETRIAERTRLAEYHRKDQGIFGRALSRTGLALANTWDRVTAPFEGDRTVFGKATIFGILRGAALGAVVGVLGIVAAPATLGAGFFLAAAAVGGTVAAVKDGQTKLEHHWRKQNHHFSDTIAEKTGAVPGPYHYMDGISSDIRHDLDHPERKSELVKKGEALLAKDPSFVESEKARRQARYGSGPNVIRR